MHFAALARLVRSWQLLSLALLSLGCATRAALVETPLEYSLDGGAERATGFVVYDSSWGAPRPGVLVAHQWHGLGPTEREHARELAAAGFVGFAADLYGADCRGADCGVAASQQLRQDPPLLRARLARALGVLSELPYADGGRLAVNGCVVGRGGPSLWLDFDTFIARDPAGTASAGWRRWRRRATSPTRR